MPHKVHTSARRSASAADTMTMVVVKGAALKDLSRVALPTDTAVALFAGTSGADRGTRVEAIRDAVGEIGAEIREFVVVRDAPVASAKPDEARPINPAAFEPDARSRAILAGVRIAQQDLEDAGGSYDLEQVRTLLRGISRQAIDRRVLDGSLLAVPGPSRQRRYPTLQFNRDGSIVAGLRAVREVLPVESPWSVLNFLVNPDRRLDGRRPIDALKAGEISSVVEAARLYGEPGG